MADVTFRRGVEANLPTSGMATEGCVYQSTDTGNMYVGSSQGTLIPVNRSPYYGTCTTQASTNAKVVTLDVDDDNFTMKAGVMISVLFSNANTAASPTLNVNNKGAVAVKVYGTTNVSASPRAWEAGEVVTFVHNGSYWMMVGHKVQSDWNQTDTAAEDFIKNKPTNVSAFTNDAGYITTNDIPEGAAASTTTPKMDGVAEIGTELAFARGDHRHPSDTSKQDKLTAGTDLEIVDLSPRLPSEYTELEYLESSGSQRIDIGLSLDTSKDDVEITFQLTDISFTNNIFGARYQTTSRVYTFASRNTGKYRCGWGTSSPDTETEIDTLKHTLKIEHAGGIFKLDGSPIYTFGNSSIITPTTATLFAIHSTAATSSYYYSKVRIFEFKMWRDGVLVKHYVPCKNQNDVLGMYDLVASSNQFKQKDSGSDDFIAGSAVLFGKTINFTNDSGFITSADLPTKTSDLTNDGSDGTSTYVEADELASVATSGSYSDLSGTPTIPTVNNATLTIKQGGTTKGTFTANASQDVEINLDAGGGGGAGTLDTTNTTSLPPSASESLGGSVSLHKVSKTGTYSDLIGTPTYALGETTGGPASLTVGLPYGTIDATSTNTLMTATVNGITELRDGVTCIIVNNVVGSASGYTLNVNNLGAKPVYYFYDDTTQSSTAFTVGKTAMFVYDSTKVSGGCWNMMYPFDSSISASTYLIRTYYSTLPLATALGRYRLLFISADGTKFVPANSSTSTSATSSKTVTTEKIDPFGKIVYYNTTTTRTAGQTVNISYQYLQNRLTLGYSFNRTGVALTLTTNTPVYIKCSPQTDGSVIIDGTTPFVQALPNTEDGYVYIYLGIATSETQIELMMNHPVYWYKGGMIREWTNGIAANDSNLVHKTGNENIGGTKTFSSNVVLGTSANLVLASAQDEGVYLEATSSSGGTQALTFSSLDDDSAVRLENVATPTNNTDAANKEYVDNAVGNTYVSLNGVADIYGIQQQSLCAFAFTAYPTAMAMTSFTTSGGTGSKTPITNRWFPIGCKIYYHDGDTQFTGSFTSKKFYSTYNGVDARYSSVTGTNISLSSTKAVYLMVEVSENGFWKPYYKSGETYEIIVTDTISTGHFYIYLGRTIGSTGYMFQLEDNNQLYCCIADESGTHLIDWASYKTSASASVYESGEGIEISNNIISATPRKIWKSAFPSAVTTYFNSTKTITISSSSNQMNKVGLYRIVANFVLHGGIDGTYGTGARSATISLGAYKNGSSSMTNLKSVFLSSLNQTPAYNVHLEDYVYLGSGTLIPCVVIVPNDGYVCVGNSNLSGTNYTENPTISVEYIGTDDVISANPQVS